MNRITGNNGYYPNGYCKSCEFESCEVPCGDKEMYDKLNEYEDLEEQNRLIKLPLKIGDIVYSSNNSRINDYALEVYRIYSITIEVDVNSVSYSFNIELINDNPHAFQERIFTYDDIGKDIFLTKEEALEKRKKI